MTETSQQFAAERQGMESGLQECLNEVAESERRVAFDNEGAKQEPQNRYPGSKIATDHEGVNMC